jgi:hypothetical protein
MAMSARRTEAKAAVNGDQRKDEIAKAGAEYHRQCYCSYLPLDQQQRVGEVIYDVILAALYAYDGINADRPAPGRPQTYPISFSAN